MNRQGEKLDRIGTLSGFLRDVRISPDGSHLTLSRFNDTDRVFDLMLLDLRRPTAAQLTYGTTAVQSSWSADGSAIMFSNVTAQGASLVMMADREGATPSSVVTPGGAVVNLSEPSPDGRSVVYGRVRPDGNGDIYLHALDQRGGPDQAFLATPAFETGARFSPDGAWVAYQSNETGIPEVFIRSFPAGTDKMQVSQDGGHRPVWSRDGKEVFFLSGDVDMMAATVIKKPTLTVGTPKILFRTPIDPGSASVFYQFDVHPDGRFAMIVPETDAPQPFNVILNWQRLLKK
jgi:Tol biopolymer transport system component